MHRHRNFYQVRRYIVGFLKAFLSFYIANEDRQKDDVPSFSNKNKKVKKFGEFL
jgi:hypothetical protein